MNDKETNLSGDNGDPKINVPVLEYRNFEGQMVAYYHPTIIGLKEGENFPGHNDEVEVTIVPNQPAEAMTMGTYCESIGSDYQTVYNWTQHNPDTSFLDLTIRLHKQIVNERGDRVARRKKQFAEERGLISSQRRAERDRDNYEATTKEHSPVWQKIINDLGLEGLMAIQSREREDIIDNTDEFLVMDQVALDTDGEETGASTYIGIQRSFAPDDFKRLRFIPERPEAGPVFIVFLHEQLKRYEGLYDKMALARMKKLQKLAEEAGMDASSYLDKEAREAGISPKQYMEQKIKMPPVSSVLHRGFEEQVEWVMEILIESKVQIEDYLKKVDDDYILRKLENKIETIDRFLNQIQDEFSQVA